MSDTYLFEEKSEGVLFTVTQGDYSKVAEGERRFEESYNKGDGWNPILVSSLLPDSYPSAAKGLPQRLRQAFGGRWTALQDPFSPLLPKK